MFKSLKCSEGVVIFTGMRVSASSLKCTSQPVRTRSSRFGRSGSPVSLLAGVFLLGSPASISPVVEPHPRPCRAQAAQAAVHRCPVHAAGSLPRRGDRQPPHSQGVGARPHLPPAGDPYDPAAVEPTSTPSGTPATSTTSASSASTSPQPACQLLIYVREKPTIRAIDYTGSMRSPCPTCRSASRRPRWRSPSRASTTPPGEARRGRPKDLLGRARPPVRHHPTEVKTIPPASVGLTFHIKEGPTVKVGKIAFTATITSATASCARRW